MMVGAERLELSQFYPSAPKADASTNFATLPRIRLNNFCPTEGDDALDFRFEGAVVVIFAMMARVFTVGMLLLVEVNTQFNDETSSFDITMKARVASTRQDADIALFFTLLVLEGVSEPAHQVEGVFFGLVDAKFHRFLLIVGALGIPPRGWSASG